MQGGIFLEFTITKVKFEEISHFSQYLEDAGMEFYRVRESTTWLAAKISDKIVGIMGVEFVKTSALFKSAYVLEEYRGKGIFDLLLANCLDLAVEIGCKQAIGYCLPPSIRAFSKKGFRVSYKYNERITCMVKKLYTFNRKRIMNAQELCELIEGELVFGDNNLPFYDAVDFPPLAKKPYTLVFLYHKLKTINLKRLERLGSCIVVFEEGTNLPPYHEQLTYIKVKNMITAYWNFINYYRGLFDIPVFAITGTCGKTTTKEMIKHILSGRYSVQSTHLSDNTTLSNLEYLCGITEKTDMAVFETPVSGPGLLRFNCLYFKPTIGMITNIGVDHLLYCKTLENYIKAKSEIIAGLNYEGTLLLNADDERIKTIPLNEYRGKIVYFGLSDHSDFKATDIKYIDKGMKFNVRHQSTSVQVVLPEFGRHQVINALGAIAAVNQVGISVEEAANRLSTFKNVQSHLEVFESINGSTIIDDTWSSNPTSMEVALEVMHNIIKGKRKIVLLGGMSLLGKNEKEIHQEVGKMIAKNNIDVLITYGDLAKEIATGARMHQMKGAIHTCDDAKAVENILMPYLDQNTSVLLKVSMYDKSIMSFLNKLKEQKS
jgi:UDP-N-acetylmuramoyl-tripeptide--D-alanyl-D-alanine ligase